MALMTIRVYRVDPETGERVEISRREITSGSPDPWHYQGMDNYPPCACPSPTCKAPRTTTTYNPVTYYGKER